MDTPSLRAEESKIVSLRLTPTILLVIISAVVLSLPIAHQLGFSPYSLIIYSLSTLITCGLAGFLVSPPYSRTLILLPLLYITAAAASYSIARQTLTLIPWGALFSIPGVFFGSVLAMRKISH